MSKTELNRTTNIKVYTIACGSSVTRDDTNETQHRKSAQTQNNTKTCICYRSAVDWPSSTERDQHVLSATGQENPTQRPPEFAGAMSCWVATTQR